MKQPLLFFNPDHDLALAHGTFHYVSPASALAFAHDAAALPAWIYPLGKVLVPELPSTSFVQQCLALGVTTPFITDGDLSSEIFPSVIPWGWNYNLKKRLEKRGLQCFAQPSDEALSWLRDCAHRRISIAAASFLRNYLGTVFPLPEPAEEICTMEDAEAYVRNHRTVIFKMPWSGSGRGLRKVESEMSTHQYGWVRQSIRRFGCIMAEPFHQVVQDFAMEFVCNRDGAQFAGYSLFHTQHGVYTENLLLSDDGIEQILSQYIDKEKLVAVRNGLKAFLEKSVCSGYEGCVGVDMFFYEDDGRILLNPFVELNLRATMGYLSAIWVRRFLATGSEGVLHLRFEAENGVLQSENERLTRQNPIRIVHQKVVRGHLALTPITPQTHYAVVVEVQPNSSGFTSGR